ncbi:MAG: hypothetical protein WKG07_03935 [Hymenobacter sp.]
MLTVFATRQQVVLARIQAYQAAGLGPTGGLAWPDAAQHIERYLPRWCWPGCWAWWC